MVAVIVGFHDEDIEREICIVFLDRVCGELIQHPGFVAGIPERIQKFADPQTVIAERAVRDRFVCGLERRVRVLPYR